MHENYHLVRCVWCALCSAALLTYFDSMPCSGEDIFLNYCTYVCATKTFLRVILTVIYIYVRVSYTVQLPNTLCYPHTHAHGIDMIVVLLKYRKIDIYCKNGPRSQPFIKNWGTKFILKLPLCSAWIQTWQSRVNMNSCAGTIYTNRSFYAILFYWLFLTELC